MSLIELAERHDGPRWQGRRPRGMPRIRVMSVTEAKRLRPKKGSVVVSIWTPHVPRSSLRPGWVDTLSLTVEDVDEWGNVSEEAPLDEPARQLAAFIVKHQRAPEIVLHCLAGLSRSRSAAAAICAHFHWDYQWTVLHEPFYRAISHALKDATKPR